MPLWMAKSYVMEGLHTSVLSKAANSDTLKPFATDLSTYFLCI